MSKEAMQMALHTLEGWANYGKWVWPESALEQAKRNTTESIAALRQALEEKQEPVAWRFRSGTWFNREVHWRYIDTLDGAEGLRGLQPLYTAPPKRGWVGLTDEERHGIREWQRIQEELGPVWAPMMLYLYEAIEAKLKERNT